MGVVCLYHCAFLSCAPNLPYAHLYKFKLAVGPTLIAHDEHPLDSEDEIVHEVPQLDNER